MTTQARGRRTAILLAVGIGASLGLLAPLRAAEPASLHADKLAEIDNAVQQATTTLACPGAVVWLEHGGQSHHRAYGKRARVPLTEPMSEDTIFDAASLTKVVATATSVMILVERGKIELDAPVHRLLPAFRGDGRDAVTIRHLLTHSSGLRPGIPPQAVEWNGAEAAIALACGEKPLTPPGSRFRYSDVNFILLGEIVRVASGSTLDVFASKQIYQPLGMPDTGFLPPAEKISRIAPTERKNGTVLRGTVHDPTARRMGGVAGHAGLFTTAADLARFCRMILHQGSLDGKRIMKPETVRMMTTVQSPEQVADRRGLGWDIDSPYSRPRGDHFPLGSFGHTGWTGTSLWIDPFSRTFLVFLSNRNHPTEAGDVRAVWNKLGTLAAEAVPDFNFTHVPGALAARKPPTAAAPASPRSVEVRNGIDVLARKGFAPLAGLRVGLVTNHTGHDRKRQSTIDLLRSAPEVKLLTLFSPEHGIRGHMDGNVGDSKDESSGLTIHSLYGANRQPSPGQLSGLDALVFDIQDIGCRFYTYISTLSLCMEAAAQAKIRFFVLDRVNPVNGRIIEGPVHGGPPTFVACHPVPLRHAMTIGEIALLLRAERNWDLDLTVIPLEGWSRELWFDETGLPWTNPSPNMRGINAAALYPGIGLLEDALAVGRGTDTPFEIVGAPYLDDLRFAAEMNRAKLPGVRFVPVRFTPTASTFKDQACGGASIVVTDREALRPVDVGLTVCLVLQKLHPDRFPLAKISHLLSHPPTLDAIRTGKPLEEIKRLWAADLAGFERRRKPHLLY